MCSDPGTERLAERLFGGLSAGPERDGGQSFFGISHFDFGGGIYALFKTVAVQGMAKPCPFDDIDSDSFNHN